MTKAEQELSLIEALEYCKKKRPSNKSCAGCPYAGLGCGIDAAIEKLKAQEPRVMTWKEAQASVNSGPFIIMEVRDSTGTEVDYGVLVEDSYEMSEGSLLTVCDFWMLEEEYGKCFRCWTSRPTDAQREAVKWG